jgi:hypothetical protein
MGCLYSDIVCLGKICFSVRTNIRLELGVDEIQKSRLRWIGHMMRMTEERKPKKMQHTETEGK